MKCKSPVYSGAVRRLGINRPQVQCRAGDGATRYAVIIKTRPREAELALQCIVATFFRFSYGSSGRWDILTRFLHRKEKTTLSNPTSKR